MSLAGSILISGGYLYLALGIPAEPVLRTLDKLKGLYAFYGLPTELISPEGLNTPFGGMAKAKGVDP